MGSRVRALGADMTRGEHRRALANLEATAESYLEDREKGAGWSVKLDFRAVAADKASRKKAWLPRGLDLFRDAPDVIAVLLSEIHRRDELLRKAEEWCEDLADEWPQSGELAREIRDFLGDA